MAAVRLQLVLDIGGVLVADLTPSFWQWVGRQAGLPGEVVLAQFRQEMREALWTGAIGEDEFWAWLCARFPPVDAGEAKGALAACLTPLPALSYLPAWSQSADLHLLSNHRLEWIAPVLRPIQDYVTSITISSVVGSCKPYPAIYAMVADHIPPGAPVLFVDDQSRNLAPAAALGWDTLCADSAGSWTRELSSHLF